MLVPIYDRHVVLLSVLVAVFASYVALDLARRVRASDAELRRVWIAGGALVMGSGIWSMHFVGMLAMRLPIAIGYEPFATFLSWCAAVLAAALALSIAARESLGAGALLRGALALGLGISTMHYVGMAALRIMPGIDWSPGLVALSVGIAVAASGAALLIFFGLRRLRGAARRAGQAVAALVMGAAISGMHYTGMAAAGFPADAVCLSAGGLGGQSLGTMVVLAAVVLLSITLMTSLLDARLQARASGLARSLASANEQLHGANAELRRLAFLDPLTGIANRALLEDRLEHALDRIDRRGADDHGRGVARLAVLCIDLDGFKPINDSYGHAAGDAVLRQVAERLREDTRDADTLARIGGDEFVLLLEDVAGVVDAAEVAERMLERVSRPFDLEGRPVSLSCSIGVVVYPDQARRDRLMADADAAMVAAKRAGGSTWALFEPHMHQGAWDQLELQQALRDAIAGGRLHLHYQPKVDSRSGRLLGVEALLRWDHPTRGPIGPAVFIPIAERFGLISSLGNWVIEEACRQIAEWGAAGRAMRVSINLSAHQLRQADVVDRLHDALRRHRVSADQLVCEITESVAMENTAVTQRVIERLSALGVRLSIDDFGTGYSSLASLRQLRVQELKIDRAFVRDVAASADARAVVDAVVRLAHALGLRVVAEGVETEAQRATLIELGCDELQGFYFARPMSPQALVASRLMDGGEAAEGATERLARVGDAS